MQIITDPLRRRYMLAAIRLAQSADPAPLNDIALFDLFALIGEPDFDTWRTFVEQYETQHALPEDLAEPSDGLSRLQPSHREFDAQLRRQRAAPPPSFPAKNSHPETPSHAPSTLPAI